MEHKIDIARMVYVAASAALSALDLWRSILPVDIPSLIAVVVGGYPVFREAYFHLRSKSITTEVAMSIGIIASLLINEYLTALIITLFTLLSEFIEELTTERGKKAVESLIKLSPTLATVKRNGQEVTIDISQVIAGETVIVKSGGKIPADGIVLSGGAHVNQAPITGESVPIFKEHGDEVFAGTFDTEGVLEIRVERVGKDTTLSRIIQLVEEAEASKGTCSEIC